MKGVWCGVLLGLVLALGVARAQDIKFEAALDKSSVGVGENFTLALVLIALP